MDELTEQEDALSQKGFHIFDAHVNVRVQDLVQDDEEGREGILVVGSMAVAGT